ncbi:MAG: hypothetical protein NTV49_04110 [Kiritimatiellaeota bacterium]|nr:hypothetical protein [Kiritimatiellota bacterium]
MKVELKFKRPTALEHIAFWQFLGFVLLIGLLWADQSLDLSQIIFLQPQSSGSWLGACLITAGIIVIGFITIAHTYVQQKKMLQGFIRVCSYCKKVKIENNAWEQIEKYVMEHSRAEFSHGICPDCYRRVTDELQADVVAPPLTEKQAP